MTASSDWEYIPSPNLSWRALKAQGKRAFENSNYDESLSNYKSALHPDLDCPNDERQLILSNIVACRLQIGGPAQAEAAVQAAKQCIALNDKWAKGHVRLASAYIALGGHSNDACNSLQRALRLDPHVPNANQMLLRELRRDRIPRPTAPPQDQDDQTYTNTASSQATTNSNPNNNNFGADDNAPPEVDNDEITWMHRVKQWYSRLSNEKKTLLQILVVILILYIGMGGRFGFEKTSSPRGNYERGNAYDRYYHDDKYRYSSYQKGDYNYHYGGSNYDDGFGRLLSLLVVIGLGYLLKYGGTDFMDFFMNFVFYMTAGRMYRGRRRFAYHPPPVRRRRRW